MVKRAMPLSVIDARRGLALRSKLALVLGIAVLAVSAGPVEAETLQDALAAAYRTNPTLAAARANQRATDEFVPLAKADGRPAASAGISYTEQIARTAQTFPNTGYSLETTPARSLAGQASVSVPLYSGGSIRNAVRAARAQVEAGRSGLRGTEAAVFSSVAAAYMDVIRDSELVVLNEGNVATLEVNRRAVSDRYAVGDLTRTDVVQSQSRLDMALADLERARAQLIGSKENYLALVGSPPQDLEIPPTLQGLPDTPDAAVADALSDNPDLTASRQDITAAGYDVRAAKGQVMPRVTAFADGSYADFLGSEDSRWGSATNRNAAVGLSISLPLYQGGRPAAAQRQAQARKSAAMEHAMEVERGVVAQVRASYASWRAALATSASMQSAVEAAELALQGVKAEHSVGTRTVLDILNAQQEALSARGQLVTAQRDAYVAGFTLLAAMGHADARELGLHMSGTSDPGSNYRRVRGKVFDYSFDPEPARIAPSTAPLPAQDGTPVKVTQAF